ncbi:MAG: hypothetical protein IT467_05785 [Dokdonella sp.]|uniref:hypothetical protein n=1 Tax=Dokdonella sp. TaxID=2291710 RepID=UPI0025C29689|nr:hypothetical protein [Dokdonella sp.]MBZ0223249.1 hypothetical protein [Dokdonella sp.]MCC7255428.1 hypothetical protein [Dokdonella sp.]
MTLSAPRILVAATGLAALLAFAPALAVTPKDPPSKEPAKAAAAKPETLKFSAEGSAKAKGAFKGSKSHFRDYSVPMTAGQTLEVTLTDKPGTTFAFIYRPGAPQIEGEGRKHWKVEQAVDGEYVVHVFLTKSAVDKGESSTYELTVTRK